MSNSVIVSTAYLPPVEYFSLFPENGEIVIELWENYHKQTFRNRCYILSSHGPQMLSVPVYAGSLHKTALKDITIDYSKRWQQVHLRAMIAAYGCSPFFEYYHDEIFRIISDNHKYLVDLNMALTAHLAEITGFKGKIEYSGFFEALTDNPFDYRYRITPKKQPVFTTKQYSQVFRTPEEFIPGLSIVDLIFNMGPETKDYLKPNQKAVGV